MLRLTEYWLSEVLDRGVYYLEHGMGYIEGPAFYLPSVILEGYIIC